MVKKEEKTILDHDIYKLQVLREEVEQQNNELKATKRELEKREKLSYAIS